MGQQNCEKRPDTGNVFPRKKNNKDAYWILYKVSGDVYDDKDELDERQTLQAARRQMHCIFRLVSVLFNNEFKGSVIGFKSTRFSKRLDSRVSSNNSF